MMTRPLPRRRAVTTGLLSIPALARPVQAGILDEPWKFQTPEATTFLLLVAVLVLTTVAGLGLYRALLVSHVKRIEHPQTLGWSLAFAIAGINLWVLFAILFYMGFIGIGIPAVLAAIFIFLAVMMLVLGRVKKWLIFLLLALTALVVFQLILN